MSWALYDWGNSAFATTVMAGFFPVFFKEFWNAGVDPTLSTARLGLANSVAGLTVALLAPALGTIADAGATKKRFLATFAALGMVMTCALGFVAAGCWQGAIFCYILAAIGFSGGNVFYDALLPAVAPRERLDAVSALGYALGYLGGGLFLGLNLWMVSSPAVFHLASPTAAVRAAFVLTGLWWFVFTLPLLRSVPEPPVERKITGRASVRAAWGRLARTFSTLRTQKNTLYFLLAYWLYMDGVHTIIRMALDYGLALGLEATDLLLGLLVTQCVGFPAALCFGWLGSRLGARQGIICGIMVYLGVTVFGAFITTRSGFFILALTIGLVQGGVQALSRSFFATLIPPDKTAEYFGFYNMMGKFSVILGPALVGTSALVVRNLGAPAGLASRLSLVSIGVLFLLGLTLLSRVRPAKG